MNQRNSVETDITFANKHFLVLCTTALLHRRM